MIQPPEPSDQSQKLCELGMGPTSHTDLVLVTQEREEEDVRALWGTCVSPAII